MRAFRTAAHPDTIITSFIVYKKGGHWNIDGSSIQRERPIVTGDSRLTNRWSQPLAGVMTTFGFIKQFSDFVTLAAASGGSAQTR
jgi:hypothetical protein